MKRLALLSGIWAASLGYGSITSVSSGDALLGNRSTNLLVNGSFEADTGFAINPSFWATGTANTPFVSLTGWSSSGQSAAYAIWGHTVPGQIQGSGPIPHGEQALYFGAFIISGMTGTPIFNPDGTVYWSGAPGITADPAFGPVTLSQTLTGLNTSQNYLLDFWASGENAAFANWKDGFFGLDITGENTLYFAAPGGQSALGSSQRYYVVFKPSASTVSLTFTNWGHYNDTSGDFHSELCLDDVIVNPVPEPATVASLGGALVLLAARRRRV